MGESAGRMGNAFQVENATALRNALPGSARWATQPTRISDSAACTQADDTDREASAR